MADVEVEGVRLPGMGWRYDLALPRGVRLVLVVEDSGPRHLMMTEPGRDDALLGISLTSDQAMALATLLTGARFSVAEPQGSVRPVGWPASRHGVAIETVDVEAGSILVGVPANDLQTRLGSDAALLGVLSDQTPEILEEVPERPFRVGDRLVLALRRSRAEDVVSRLLDAGPEPGGESAATAARQVLPRLDSNQ